LQSCTVIDVNEFEGETSTSKYTGEREELGIGTGSELYSATTIAPLPLAVTTVLSLLALAVPVGLLEEPLAELTVPAGGGGGVGDTGTVEGDGAGGDWVTEVLVSITESVKVVPSATQLLPDGQDKECTPVSPAGWL
jgi:hypothetical protein